MPGKLSKATGGATEKSIIESWRYSETGSLSKNLKVEAGTAIIEKYVLHVIKP